MLEAQDQGTNMVTVCWGLSSLFVACTFSLCPHIMEEASELCEVFFISYYSHYLGSALMI